MPARRTLDLDEEENQPQLVGSAEIQALQRASPRKQQPQQLLTQPYAEDSQSACSSVVDSGSGSRSLRSRDQPSSQHSSSKAYQAPPGALQPGPRPPTGSASGHSTPRTGSGKLTSRHTYSPQSPQHGSQAEGYGGEQGELGGMGTWVSPNLMQAAMQDEYSMLLADTPLEKLRRKQEEVAREEQKQAKDGWKLVKLHQDMLALAKVHNFMHRHDDHRPLLLPTAHYQLAKRYAALGCTQQASEHCHRAVEQLPSHGQHLEEVQALQCDISVLLAEGYLKADPPKPQMALQHLHAAAGTSNLAEGPQRLDVLVLACQALMMQADGKLQEAKGTRLARERLSITQDEVALNMRKAEQGKRVLELSSLRERLNAVLSEQEAEEAYEAQLVEQSLQQLEEATQLLFNACEAEEKRLEQAVGRKDMRQDPLVHRLRRQLCDVIEKEAQVQELRGNLREQKRALSEILSVHEVYGCVPAAQMARALKQLGSVLVKAHKYDEALEHYQSLVELQQQRYTQDFRKQELALAECYKLCGNVYVARKEFGRAAEHYDLAYGKYIMELGPQHALVLDLEHRRRELQSYTDPELAGPVASER